MRVLLGHEDDLEEEVRDVLDVELDNVVRPFWNWSSISLEDNINNTDSVQDDNNCYSFRTIKYDPEDFCELANVQYFVSVMTSQC